VIHLNISSTSNSNSSTNYGRLTGLATGLDTDGLVKQALAGDQTKIDSVKQDLQYTQWQQEAYVGFITDLKSFGDYFDILKPDNLMLSGAYTGTTASSTLSSGVAADNYLTATTLPGAINGTYQVQINSLAEGAKTQGGITGLGFIPPTDKSILTGDIVLNIAGVASPKTITLNNYTKDESIDSIVQKIQDSINADDDLKTNVKAINDNGKIVISSISGNTTKLASTTVSQLQDSTNKQINSTFSSTTKLSDLGIASPGDFTIKIGTLSPFTVKVSAGDSINDLVNSLKTATNGTNSLMDYANISFSSLTNKLTIETKDTGTSNTMVIDSTSTTNILGIAGSYTGKDASLAIKAPGESNFVQVTKSTNTFSLDNIKYNLVSAKPGDNINLTVKSDASAQVDKISKFIDKYNELIDKINTKINEKKSYSYKPLTDAQKASMKDSEITAWEAKAKEGILRRDNYLSGIVSQLRQAVYNTVKGSGINITDIGITTTSNYTDGGKLVVDKDKLKTALEQKGDLVQNLFTKGQVSDMDEDKGIFQRFKTILNNTVGTDGTLIKKAGYTNSRWVTENDLSKSIATKNAKIKDMQAMMTQKQQRLYSMYATLEQNMNNLNSQSTWLSSSLGSQ
jgi:flagellar hook-associated protein 2